MRVGNSPRNVGWDFTAGWWWISEPACRTTIISFVVHCPPVWRIMGIVYLINVLSGYTPKLGQPTSACWFEKRQWSKREEARTTTADRFRFQSHIFGQPKSTDTQCGLRLIRLAVICAFQNREERTGIIEHPPNLTTRFKTKNCVFVVSRPPYSGSSGCSGVGFRTTNKLKMPYLDILVVPKDPIFAETIERNNWPSRPAQGPQHTP
jgi:hypothetical protein